MTKAKKEDSSLYDRLISMAEEWNVSENTLFLSAAQQYAAQQDVIRLIKAEIDGADALTSEKTYVKGAANLQASPLIKELPRHTDSANKTLQTMLDIITKLGKRTEKETALSKFNKEFE